MIGNVWKLLVVSSVIALAGIATFVLVPSQQMESGRQSSNMMLLEPGVVAQSADKILADTKAKVLVLWSADIQINSRTVLYAHDAGGVVASLAGTTDQIFSESRIMNTFMTQLLSGRLNCGQVNTASKVGQYVAAVGAPSICRRGIVKDGVLIGYISLSYPTVPSDKEVARIGKLLDDFLPSVMVGR